MNLAGALIPDAAHASVVRVFTRELAAPLSITRYAFPLQPAPPHVAYLGGGQRLRPRDALKFGQLILDAGRWNGRRVVDARWIHVIITPQAHVRGEIGAYGEAWHIYTYVVRGRRVTAISAGGNGGQLVFAIPAYDLAIAINAGNYNQYPVWRSFITSTIPAILDAVAGSGGHSRIAGDTR
jgi:CubicO group peptidase (beta-lactamase class C family)